MRFLPAKDQALTFSLAPLLAAQALWVGARAMRLPEPSGPRDGHIGDGPLLRLLVLGDSSAAGVGVAKQSQALASQLAAQFAQSNTVNWHLAARNGATAADAGKLLKRVNAQVFDVAFIVFGVNDTKNLHSERTWRADLTDVADTLRSQYRTKHLFFSGVPPMQDFPLLPRPLRHVLGLRAQRFDTALQHVAQESGSHHLPIDLPLDPENMAADGFHPGAASYAIWAEEAAQRMRAKMAATT